MPDYTSGLLISGPAAVDWLASASQRWWATTTPSQGRTRQPGAWCTRSGPSWRAASSPWAISGTWIRSTRPGADAGRGPASVRARGSESRQGSRHPVMGQATVGGPGPAPVRPTPLPTNGRVEMKLATYRPADPQSPAAGIGAVVDGRLVDLNYAFACLPVPRLGRDRARAIAAARVPREHGRLLARWSSSAGRRRTARSVWPEGQGGRAASTESGSATTGRGAAARAHPQARQDPWRRGRITLTTPPRAALAIRSSRGLSRSASSRCRQRSSGPMIRSRCPMSPPNWTGRSSWPS